MATTRPSARSTLTSSTASATAPTPSPGSPPPASHADADNALALYVHWPFCVTKCPYCDFNSHVRPGWDEAAYRRALLADLAHEAAATPNARLASIFFGGGTPSLMAPATVAAVIEAAATRWTTSPAIEIALEANPSSVEAARFAGFSAAGVNRVSLGLQALDDAALRFLGRPHDLAESLAALDLAQRSFPRVSVDLIAARPGQTVAAWEAELTRALGFGTEHLSLYQLTIEQGTRFHTLHAQRRFVLPDEAQSLALFETTQALTEAAGLPAYETSNHARRGAESRHNLTYWTYGDYAGIGPGAHGRRNRHATVRHRRPEAWLDAVAAHGHGIGEIEALGDATRAEEALLMGLRLTDGIAKPRFAARTGRAFDTAVRPGAVAALAALGLAHDTAHRFRLTRAGRPLVNAVLARLAA